MSEFITWKERNCKQFSANQFKIIQDHPTQIFWQPGIIFRAGWKNILFQSGVSYTADLTNPDLQRAKFNFHMGLVLKGNTRGKTK